MSGNKANTRCRINYQDPNDRPRTWESAERATRPKNSEIDGVGIVAILEKSTGNPHPFLPRRKAS